MSKRIYPIDKSILILFKDLNIQAQDVLKRADLPLDFFSRKQAGLSPQQYFDFWGAMESLSNSPTFPLDLARSVTVESFSPPVFACFCSPNFKLALGRLAHYKDLVAPIQFVIEHTPEQTSVVFESLPELGPCPISVIAMEYAFLTHIARLATREHIVPKDIVCNQSIVEQAQYESFLGCHIKKGNLNQISFHKTDVELPFLSASESIWEMFEPELNLRLSQLKSYDNLKTRVKSSLSGVMASGDCTINSVAKTLAMSPRTLQRHLKQEKTSFQEILSNLRHELSLQYLKKTSFTDVDIAFLLGYKETNSYTRAFQSWTGKSPKQMRTLLNNET